MKPIILWELKQRKSYLIWWTVSTLGLIALLLLLYPSIHDQAANLNKVLNQLPESLRTLKTGGSQVDIASPIGYLNSQLYYVTLPLLQIIMAIGLGRSLLARDEENHTLELIQARPISRSKVLAAKAISGLILILIVSALAALLTVGLAKLVDMDIAAGYILLASAYATLFSLSFGALAFMLTAAGKPFRHASTALALVLSFGGYVLTSLSGLSHAIQVPAKFMPYHYYNPTEILAGHIRLGLNLYLIGIAILSVIVSWIAFNRRDLD